MDKSAEPIILRQAQAVWVPIVIWLFCALILIDAIVEASAGYAFRIACLMAAIAYVVYLVLARPSLKIDREGLTVANVLRTHRIPYGALMDIRVGGLTSFFARTARGERHITSWNAPGVKRSFPRPMQTRGNPGAQAMIQEARLTAAAKHDVESLIVNRWDAWKLSKPRGSEQPTLISRWNWRSLLLATALIALNIAIRLR